MRIREEGRVVGLLGAVQDVTERRAAEIEVRRLNANLEECVAERTAALAEINDELKACIYTVSHDALLHVVHTLDHYWARLNLRVRA